MKYEDDIIFASALPDAPLAMPKQSLERRRTPAVQPCATLWRPFPGSDPEPLMPSAV